MYSIDIKVYGGKGGDGAVSFLRERYRPFGGPDGGDGGNGGNVYVEADNNTRDLSQYRNNKVFKAENGKPGGKQKMHGRDGADIVLKVPVGTLVKVFNREGSKTYDLMRSGQKLLVAKGGKGGLGNVHFATATNRMPRRAGEGREGESADLHLEYRIPHDVSVVGLPNSGKSQLLSAITNARVEIAEYPMTTREPVIGVYEGDNGVIRFLEVPAVVDGSADGKGLGNVFLSHLHRSRLILFLLDVLAGNIRDQYNVLMKEVTAFDKTLLEKPRLIVLNKVDVEHDRKQVEEFVQHIKEAGEQVVSVSAENRSGVAELLKRVSAILKQQKAEGDTDGIQTDGDMVIFRPRPLKRSR